METKELLPKIRSVKLCLMAHPDNSLNSEFADRISDLEEIETFLKKYTMNPKELHQFVNYLYMNAVYSTKGENLLGNHTRAVQSLAKLQHILAEKLEELEEKDNI